MGEFSSVAGYSMEAPDAPQVGSPAVGRVVVAQSKRLGVAGVPSRRRSPLARGLRLLDHLREGPATMSELTEVLGVNRSTALRLVRELRQAGYIEEDRASRMVALNSRKFGVAPGGAWENVDTRGSNVGGAGCYDWAEVVHRKLGDIRDALGESTMFAVPAGDRMLYVAFFNNDHPVGVQEAIGSARPMHASAVGKACLAALPPSTLDIVLGRLDYSGGTESAAKGPLQLRDRLDEARDQGYAVDRDETFVGLSCVAAPVILNSSALVGAAGVTGLTHRFTPERVDEFGALLLKELREIETR